MSRYGVSILVATAFVVGAIPRAESQDEPLQATPESELFFFAPETPDELIQAVVTAQRVGRPIAAKRYLQQLVSPLPVTQDLVALRRRFGIGLFLELYTHPNLQPEARQLLTAINEASVQSIPSELRIRQLLEQPGANAHARAESVLEILSAGNQAVPVLLAADPGSEAGQLADLLLTANARDLRQGLYDQLDSSNASGRVRILKLLSGVADSQMAPLLLRWQFSDDVSPEVAEQAGRTIKILSTGHEVAATREEAAVMLSDDIRRLLRSAATRFGSQDIAASQSRLPAATERTAMLQRASRLAGDLVIMAGDNPDAHRLKLVTSLALGEVVPEIDQVSMAVLDGVLQTALEAGDHVASASAIGLMQSQFAGDSSQVPNGATLADAMVDQDPRVRIAAAALLQQSGQTEFAAGMVKRQAAAVAAGSYQPEAVVIDPRQTERIDMVTTLSAADFTAAGAATGVAGFEQAVLQLQCDLILVHSNCQQWQLTATVANLRADARTAGVPIVVYGPPAVRDAIRSLAHNYEGVWFIEEPVTGLTLFQRLAWLKVPGPLLSPTDRQQLKSVRLVPSPNVVTTQRVTR